MEVMLPLSKTKKKKKKEYFIADVTTYKVLKSKLRRLPIEQTSTNNSWLTSKTERTGHLQETIESLWTIEKASETKANAIPILVSQYPIQICGVTSKLAL